MLSLMLSDSPKNLPEFSSKKFNNLRLLFALPRRFTMVLFNSSLIAVNTNSFNAAWYTLYPNDLSAEVLTQAEVSGIGLPPAEQIPQIAHCETNCGET